MPPHPPIPLHPNRWWTQAASEIWLPTAAEIGSLDRHAVDSGAISERALIENAGRELARMAAGAVPEGPVVIVSGSGHNGADALVAGRTLRACGRAVRAFRTASRAPDPDVLVGSGLELEPGEALADGLSSAALVIDGLLGTGLTAAPRPEAANVIERVNRSGAAIIAADGPSGIDFTTGAVPGAAVRATLTVTFGWPKLGLLRFPARAHCGDLLAVEIGFPPSPSPFGARAITAAWVREAMLPPRRADAHKGDAGYVALAAGTRRMAGAAVLAARAALRGGAGLVRVISHPDNREILQTSVPEAVFTPWDDESAVGEALAASHALVAGPGLGQAPGVRTRLEQWLDRVGDIPVVLDADGLNAWAGDMEGLAAAVRGPLVVTPHPREMARLLGVETEEVVTDPPAAARTASERLGGTVLLKGAPSWVAFGDRPLRVSTVLAPALATGGMGDVLSGLLGAYLATGAEPPDAAAAALMVSGVAALSGGAAVGEAAVDIPDRLVRARQAIQSHEVEPGSPPFVRFALPAARSS